MSKSAKVVLGLGKYEAVCRESEIYHLIFPNLAREDLKEIDLGHKEPDFFKRFLDEGNKIRGIIASKPIILAGLQLTVGKKVLDAGCGLGDDTFAIAQIVGSQGRAVGIDVSETMILEARRRGPTAAGAPG